MGTAATWARSLVAPRDRLLPGVGARLERHPALVVGALVALRRLPQPWALDNVSRPLVRRMRTPLVVPVAGDLRMRVDPGDLVGWVLAVAGRWEPNVTAAFRSLLRPGDVCVDVGANIGYFTLLASSLVGPSGGVHAFEPEPSTFAALEANLRLNGVANVTAHAVAAGADDGVATIGPRPPGNAAGARLVSDGAPGSRVPVRRLDVAIPGDELVRTRLVKIDVEGAEADVVRSLDTLFAARARPAVIVEVSALPGGAAGRDAVAALATTWDLERHELVDEGLFGGPHDDEAPRLRAPTGTAERHELLLLPR